MSKENNSITWVPIESIHVLNPRFRDPKKFQELVKNIDRVGLKKPITLTRRSKPTRKGKIYNLVCGQGRMEGCLALNMKEIPARILSISTEEALLQSLIENVARRAPRVREEMEHIHNLQKKGYKVGEIAKKVGLSVTQVSRYCSLSKNGETRLLHAVLKGKITAEAAAIIAQSDDADVRRLLQTAYESKKIKRDDLKMAKQVAEERLAKGKNQGTTKPQRKTSLNTNQLVHAMQKSAEKKESVVKKARSCEHKLLFIENSMKLLMKESAFVSLLKSEKLDEIPAHLAQRLQT